MRGFLVLGFGMVVVLGVVRVMTWEGSGISLSMWSCGCWTDLHALCA